MASSEIVLHHYPSSPFSEKIRVAFGIKRIAWRSVEIPNMMPKPDLMPLTGGYRKTPVMQIGADIYCDTQIILRELERRHPAPALFDGGLDYALAFWSDRLFFMPSVAVVFAEVGDMVPEAFRQDRAKMSGGTFSTDALKAAAPSARDQWRAHAGFVAETLADGRAFLTGNDPKAADIHAYMNVWWIKAAIPHVAPSLLAEFSALEAWSGRMAAFGHGNPAPMDSKEALAIAKSARTEAREAEDPFGQLQPGDKVRVAADDYGRDPVAGTVIFADAREIAIRRSAPETGEVAVHFPRAGFTVTKA
ncbi:MAG: glutathione S-transferase family protein [Alphaproteobacteria bacterium]|nr:glutathione S-transferase family protein [Alphaproteobacteria bacterium]MBV9692354.1 glutathione S-transferase family protein [Alphaproteobacteria bacterium]